MAFAQVRASHVNTTLIYCEVETQILRELKLISPDLTLKKEYFFQMKACRMFLVMPAAGITGFLVI